MSVKFTRTVTRFSVFFLSFFLRLYHTLRSFINESAGCLHRDDVPERGESPIGGKLAPARASLFLFSFFFFLSSRENGLRCEGYYVESHSQTCKLFSPDILCQFHSVRCGEAAEEIIGRGKKKNVFCVLRSRISSRSIRSAQS